MGQRLANARELYLTAIRDGDYAEAINTLSGDSYTQHSTPVRDSEFQYVTADIFDTDDDAKMVEHWDIIEEVRAVTAGNRTQLDGPIDPGPSGDAEQKEANKALVRRYVEGVLGAGDFDEVEEFVAADVAQHHPDIADGASALRAYARSTHLRYVHLHLVVGSGSFVAVLAQVEARGIPLAVIDLFRVEEGKIAEQWSVTEEITPAATWVNSGKF